MVSVTPAGRRRYLEILVPYLLANRQHLSEHHFWLNTTNQDDIAYMYGLAQQYPDFFKINSREVFDTTSPGHCIWQYWQDCVDENTMYLRLDDDICFIDPNAIPNLISFRLSHPDPFFVYGNIVNNALCSHVHQANGVIPLSWGKVAFECMDRVGWFKSIFPARVHKLFINDIRTGNTDRWKFDIIPLPDFPRFSINVVCWFGKDLKEVDELKVQDLRNLDLRDPETGEDLAHEEAFTSRAVPARFGRPCVICGNALFSHFAFYTQRHHLENHTALLEWYAALARGPVRGGTVLRLKMTAVLRFLNMFRSPWFWGSLYRKVIPLRENPTR